MFSGKVLLLAPPVDVSLSTRKSASSHRGPFSIVSTCCCFARSLRVILTLFGAAMLGADLDRFTTAAKEMALTWRCQS